MGAGAPEPVQLASRRATRMMSLSVLRDSSSSGVSRIRSQPAAAASLYFSISRTKPSGSLP